MTDPGKIFKTRRTNCNTLNTIVTSQITVLLIYSSLQANILICVYLCTAFLLWISRFTQILEVTLQNYVSHLFTLAQTTDQEKLWYQAE